jgi:endonuclease/exonuclease/phosphatase family metal-dependent hydrolase
VRAVQVQRRFWIEVQVGVESFFQIEEPGKPVIAACLMTLYQLFASMYRCKAIALAIALFFSCGHTEKPFTPGNFRLVSYNVWYGFTKVPERKSRWLAWMKERDPDVVSLQELSGYTADKLKVEALTWGHQYSVLLKEDGFPTGVTSRFPIEDIQRYREGFQHGLLRVRVNGIYLYVIHLHPSNWQVRIAETTRILDNIRTLPENVPIILAGDFNTFSRYDTPYYLHGRLEPFFQARDIDFNEHNLNDGKLDYSVIEQFMQFRLIDLEHKMRDGDYRFTGSFPTRIKKPGDHGDLRRLDYVFARTELAQHVVKAEIVADETAQVLSDHLPVIVDFKLK